MSEFEITTLNNSEKETVFVRVDFTIENSRSAEFIKELEEFLLKVK